MKGTNTPSAHTVTALPDTCLMIVRRPGAVTTRWDAEGAPPGKSWCEGKTASHSRARAGPNWSPLGHDQPIEAVDGRSALRPTAVETRLAASWSSIDAGGTRNGDGGFATAPEQRPPGTRGGLCVTASERLQRDTIERHRPPEGEGRRGADSRHGRKSQDGHGECETNLARHFALLFSLMRAAWIAVIGAARLPLLYAGTIHSTGRRQGLTRS
jgi:hypothetical protein